MADQSNGNKMGVFMAGVIGAAVGAAAVILAQEKNRKKIERAAEEVKIKGGKAFHTAAEMLDKTKNQATEKTVEVAENVKQTANDVQRKGGQVVRSAEEMAQQKKSETADHLINIAETLKNEAEKMKNNP